MSENTFRQTMIEAVETATRVVVRVNNTRLLVEISKEEALRAIEDAAYEAVSVRVRFDGSAEILEGIGRYHPSTGAFTYLPVAGPG